MTDGIHSGVYCAVVLSHAVICCLGTGVLARLQTLYVVLNILYVYLNPRIYCAHSIDCVKQALHRCHHRPACRYAKGVPEHRLICSRQLHKWYALHLPDITSTLTCCNSQRLAEWVCVHPELPLPTVDNL